MTFFCLSKIDFKNKDSEGRKKNQTNKKPQPKPDR